MKYKLTKKQKKMRNRIIIAIALLAVTAVTLHFVEVPWWADLVLYMIPYVIAGYDVLKTAFINLLDNARKATTASEAEGKSEDAKTIHFTGRIIHAEGKGSEGRKYEYIVEDHGIGIAQKDIDRICDEFYMVDKSRSRSEGGAGLGMSLVAAILKEHNASLEIESELGVGTRMIVTFSELADEEDYFEQGEEDL